MKNYLTGISGIPKNDFTICSPNQLRTFFEAAIFFDPCDCLLSIFFATFDFLLTESSVLDWLKVWLFINFLKIAKYLTVSLPVKTSPIICFSIFF